MVRRDLVRSRTEAQALIAEARVVVRGIPTPKSASLVAADTPITISPDERRWVSRGALKLLAALEEFAIEVEGKKAIDVGASTGGFTEVLMDAGARSVLALDVGRGQLHESLRADDRVTNLERTNVRHIEVRRIGGPYPIAVADLSFISLCTVASKLAELTTEDADLIVLVKPQFEASKSEVGRGGVVRDPEVRRRAIRKVAGCLAEVGLKGQGLLESPIRGGDGNLEYLLWLRKDRAMADLEVDQ